MRRKIIQLAGSTLVVSLPSKWAKRHSLAKGDELDITEIDENLIVHPGSGSAAETRKISLDTARMGPKVLGWALASLYQLGYDEITLRYESPEVVAQIQQSLKDFFVGFVVVNQTQSACVIRSISYTSENEFDTTLRRTFLVTLTMAENVLANLKARTYENLKNDLSLEKTNNQLTGYCQRILNKGHNTEAQKSQFYYSFIFNLEFLCDHFKYICFYMGKIENQAEPLDRDILAYFDDVTKYFTEHYNLFYKFSLDATPKLASRGIELVEKGYALLVRTKKFNSVVITHLISVVLCLMESVPTMIALNTPSK
jgi:phosphate uptake regulator